MSKIKVEFEISTGGDLKVKTVKGAGTTCKQVADRLGSLTGTANDASRATTPEIHEVIQEQEGETHGTVEA